MEELQRISNKSEIGDVGTPQRLADTMLDNLDQAVFESDSSTFFDPCCGRGAFVISICERLRAAGHSDDNISKRVYAADINIKHCNILKLRLANRGFRVNIWCTDTLEFKCNMKFDVIVGNPPYNLRKGNGGTSGTIGDKTYYRKFFYLALELAKKEGHIVMVTLKNIYKVLEKEKIQVDKINFMTETDYWKYDTLFFVARNSDKTSDSVIEDRIAGKLIDMNNPWRVKFQSSSTMQLKRSGIISSDHETKAIVRLPGQNNEKVEYEGVREDKIIHGPKFAFTMLESIKSYTATDEPLIGSCIGFSKTKTVEDANKLMNFVKYNKAFKYLVKVMKSKGHAATLIRTKKFNLSQIKTGTEYPAEFNLTQEEIKFIEAAIE